MKKLGIVLSFLLMPLMVLAPMAATLADAGGSGSGAGASGAAAGSGSSAGSSASSSAGAPAGAPAGAAAGAPAGAPAGAAAGTGESSGASPASVGTSPSSSATPSLGVSPVIDRRVINQDSTTVVAPSASIATTSDFVGRHTMTGTVTKVDHDKGFFRLKTAEGTLDLHAPPAVIAGVQKGDQMNVEIAVQPVR